MIYYSLHRIPDDLICRLAPDMVWAYDYCEDLDDISADEKGDAEQLDGDNIGTQIAHYDGSTLHLYISKMGRAGREYAGI